MIDDGKLEAVRYIYRTKGHYAWICMDQLVDQDIPARTHTHTYTHVHRLTWWTTKSWRRCDVVLYVLVEGKLEAVRYIEDKRPLCQLSSKRLEDNWGKREAV